MGGRTVEIKFCIFTIEKVEKKMGERTVEIKIYIFTIEKGEKNMDGRTVEILKKKKKNFRYLSESLSRFTMISGLIFLFL